ncbi:MAG: twin-arginine translocase subunit TatC [Alphaproteobacteria bacterium]|nr:twin-arginine translocase subunit TatC [Alphaproteobacteria bacterium]
MKMTLMQHFSELRRRILWTLFIFVISFCVGWVVSPYIEHILITPLLKIWDEAILLYTGITDGLLIKFSLSGLFAFIFSVPVLLWHIWAYIAPGLHKNEKQFLLPIFVLSPLLFIVGVCFAFYILFPFVFRFFIELNTDDILPTVLMPSVKTYLTFSIGLLKIFGLAFQLPLVLILLNKIGILTKQTLVYARRYVVVCIFVLSAMLTPPDVLSQILLAVPMWLLYEVSLIFMRD